MRVEEIVKVSTPGFFIRQQMACFEVEGLEKIQFIARFDHKQFYLPGEPVLELMALYEISKSPHTQISLLVSDQPEILIAAFERGLPGPDIAAELGVAWVELGQGLLLRPVHIPKPWGQEIWYTGIEARGVSEVVSEQGVSPLSWVLAAAAEQIMGEALQDVAPVLLKILDPLPDEVYGDLYFEMHEEKQEVYVVTHIDKNAWPDGRGGIRFGFNQDKRTSYASDDAFKQAYLDAVASYEAVRREIDVLFDEKRRAAQIAPDAPVLAETLREWQQALPGDLGEQEEAKRREMEAFIYVKELAVGDVVKVPTQFPHSLQHGVRTVEFQTPVYERKILSFAQKVLTQDHWDTREAIDRVSLNAAPQQSLPVLEKAVNICREEVVSFDDFAVQRIILQPGASWRLGQAAYKLLLVVDGEITLRQQTLEAGQALLLPCGQDLKLTAGKREVILLLASPDAVS